MKKAHVLQQAIVDAGGLRALARKLGVSHQAIAQQWMKRGIPPHWVHTVETVTGIPRSVLRPDIYPPERERKR